MLFRSIGHLVVDPGGSPCGCGNRGCLEVEAAGPAWRRRALELLDEAAGRTGIPADRTGAADAAGTAGSAPGGHLDHLVRDRLDARAVAEGARLGDPLCLRVVEDCARPLAAGLAAVFNILDPDAVFLGGGVAESFDLLEPILRRELPPLVLAGRDRPLPVLKSSLGYDAALVGAAVPALFPYSS